MIPSSGYPPWPPDHPRTLPRTGTPTPPRGARSSRGFDQAGCPAKPLVSYQINRQLSGWNLPPLVIRAVGAHWGIRASLMRHSMLATLVCFVPLTVSSALAQTTGISTGGGGTAPGGGVAAGPPGDWSG